MRVSFTFGADRRAMQGKGASRRLRRLGKVPAILYGGPQGPQPLVLDQQNLLTMIGSEKFYSSIVRVNVDGEPQEAIIKDVQMHPARHSVVHVDLQRVVENEAITKGFEYEKGKYVLLDQKEIDELKLEAKQTIELVRFVDQTAIDADCIRPVDRHRLVRRRIGAQGVGQRHHPGMKSATRGAQWFVGFEHNCKLREIKPTDIDERTGAAPCGDLNRMGEGIANFPQPHQSKRRRQLDGFRCEPVRARGGRQMMLQLPFLT